jgi:hypothetical protein
LSVVYVENTVKKRFIVLVAVEVLDSIVGKGVVPAIGMENCSIIEICSEK